MSSENYLIKDQHAIYFVTFTMTHWIDVFTRPRYKLQITESLNFYVKNKGLQIYCWCLMSNHLHLIWSVPGKTKLSSIIRDYKKYTARMILDMITNMPESRREWMLRQFEFAGKYDKRITKYRFWQDKSHPILIHTAEMFEQKMNYIHQNPVKAMIVAKPEDYIFSSAMDYAGEKGLVDVVLV